MNNHRRAAGVLLMLCCALLAGSASSAPAPKADSSRSSTAPTSATSSNHRLSGHFLYSKTTAGDIQSFYTVNADGQHERRLTSPGAVCCDLRVSPASGHRLLVMPGGNPGHPVTGGTISSAGTGFRRLRLVDPTLNLVPQAWSPDGTRIAFEGWQDGKPDRTGVYTARFSDGGGLCA